MRSSGNCSTSWLMSYVISVAAGEAGSGQWEGVEEDDSGMLVEVLSMGLRDRLGRFEEGKVSGIEV